MAIELCYAETIPRISLPHGFCSSMPMNTSIDFHFDVPINNIDQESCYSYADELFSNGKILPLQIRKEIIFPPPKQPQKPQPQAASKEANDENQISSKSSFWQFKRSSSLNFVSGYKRRLFNSTLLSRSSSTGSAPEVKAGQKYWKEKPYTFLQSSTNNQKPPLKRNFSCGYHGNGVRINPVLNVPLIDVFCWRSLFLTGKDKKK